jgi:hypothetical protein
MSERSGYRNGQLIYPISILDHKAKSGGGEGGLTPGVPIPADTVDTAAIQDGAVEMQDLNDSVKSKIQKTYDISDEALSMDFDVQP